MGSVSDRRGLSSNAKIAIAAVVLLVACCCVYAVANQGGAEKTQTEDGAFTITYNSNDYRQKTYSKVYDIGTDEKYPLLYQWFARDEVVDNWNTQTNGKGTEYKPGTRILLTSDITLYAIITYES